jgi:signal transduction histidine kinase/CheY-like chemotaxis protein
MVSQVARGNIRHLESIGSAVQTTPATNRGHDLASLARRGAVAWRSGIPARLLAIVGSALVIAGLVASADRLALAHILLAIGAALTGVVTLLGLRPPPSAAASEHIVHGLERLGDVEWRLRDDERRYRELLDAQTDVIARTDASGAIVFVNRAWCRLFRVEPAAVLGGPMRLDIVEGEPSLPVIPGSRRRSYTVGVATVDGPRWLAFEELAIGDGECQIVGRDVTAEHVAKTELTRARDEAIAANRAKSRFLAAMSHEIRTPMNGILGMAGLLGETPQTPDQRTYTQAIDQSARTLLAIIDEILDLSKIEAGRLEMSPVRFALEQCIQGVVELLAPKAREKGLELVWSIDPGLPSLVVGDETRVRQIALNLVGNAIKFTDAGGVRVRVRRGAASSASVEAFPDANADGTRHVAVEIEVEDTGIGIAEDQQRLLFTDFQQTEDVVARRRGGTGLGLAISRRLARAMGGEISVQSRLGEGSRFRAELSLAAVVGAAPVVSPGPLPAGRALVLLGRPLERAVVAELLIGLGVEVVAIDPVAADPTHKTSVGRFDIVMTDTMIAPDTLAETVASLRTGSERPLCSLVVIDPAERGALPNWRARGFGTWLVRPIRPASLAHHVGVQAARLGPAQLRHAARIGGASLQPALANVGTRSAGGRRILLVEDNEINALLARRVGERAGCIVTHARSGPQAIEMVRDLIACGDAIDLVLMDIHMPEMNGYEATRHLKAAWREAGLEPPPIAALTANAYPEDRRRCLDEGLDDFLAKPFEKSELEAMLDRWCPTTEDGMDEHAA